MNKRRLLFFIILYLIFGFVFWLSSSVNTYYTSAQSFGVTNFTLYNAILNSFRYVDIFIVLVDLILWPIFPIWLCGLFGEYPGLCRYHEFLEFPITLVYVALLYGMSLLIDRVLSMKQSKNKPSK